jgi:hypothetical protein
VRLLEEPAEQQESEEVGRRLFQRGEQLASRSKRVGR